MRARTITVDITRGGDYALADYRRQAARPLTIRMVQEAIEAMRRLKDDCRKLGLEVLLERRN